MNAKQTNKDKSYVYSSFKQFCLPVLEFLVPYRAEIISQESQDMMTGQIHFSLHISFPASQICKINNS